MRSQLQVRQWVTEEILCATCSILRYITLDKYVLCTTGDFSKAQRRVLFFLITWHVQAVKKLINKFSSSLLFKILTDVVCVSLINLNFHWVICSPYALETTLKLLVFRINIGDANIIIFRQRHCNKDILFNGHWTDGISAIIDVLAYQIHSATCVR